MKILLFSDCHWSTITSIVRGRGEKYSYRLEYLINSINWMEELSASQNCQLEICLGDFFDKSILNDEEISALSELKWNDIKKYFIVGNHESSKANLQLSVTQIFKPRFTTIENIQRIDFGNSVGYFIPYLSESDRLPLADLLNSISTLEDATKNKIIFSHNDISGINYGGFVSQIGFNKEEIEQNSDLYLNGHLHNSEWITNKILNVGSFSGHNFTNDSDKYKYGVWILDTDALTLNFFENPYSLNFYKFELLEKTDLDKLDNIKQNAVISIKYNEPLKDDLLNILNTKKALILETRLMMIKTLSEINEQTIAELHSDHLAKFVECCMANIPNTAILEAELSEICK